MSTYYYLEETIGPSGYLAPFGHNSRPTYQTAVLTHEAVKTLVIKQIMTATMQCCQLILSAKMSCKYIRLMYDTSLGAGLVISETGTTFSFMHHIVIFHQKWHSIKISKQSPQKVNNC